MCASNTWNAWMPDQVSAMMPGGGLEAFACDPRAGPVIPGWTACAPQPASTAAKISERAPSAVRPEMRESMRSTERRPCRDWRLPVHPASKHGAATYQHIWYTVLAGGSIREESPYREI